MKRIFLTQTAPECDLYCVDQLTDCIEPRVGAVLDKGEVLRLLARHNTVVKIRRFTS